MMVFFQVLQMIGYQVDVVCLDKVVGDYVMIVIYDFDGVQIYSEKLGYCFMLNVDFVVVKVENYDVLVIFGGWVLEYLCLNEEVIKLVQVFDVVCKFIVVVCYGLQLLVVVGILQGWICSVYFVCVLEVCLSGGYYVDIGIDQVYVDGNLVIVFVWLVYLQWLVKFVVLLVE